MAKVLRGIVDDGTREIPLYNKFGRLICNVYIRPADFSIVDRYNALMRDFASVVEPLKELDIQSDGTAAFEKDWETLKAVETELKARINALFDMEEADDIFAKRNAFSSVGGQFFCERVLNALGDVIAEAIAEEANASKKRMAKYLADVQPAAGGTEHAGAAADET